MTGTEVATAEAPGVPALVNTPAVEIGSEDIALPRVYIGQHSSTAVQEELVKPGDIYSANGKDDPDPTVLWKYNAKPDHGEGVLFHVLAMKRGKSYSEPGGELEVYAYDDPTAPAEAWTTYNYAVVLPEHDQDIPYKLLLTKTGKPAAQQINTLIKRSEGTKPHYALAFRMHTAFRENNKGKFYVARVSPVDAQDDHVELAVKLISQIEQQPEVVAATPDEQPAI